MPQTSNQRASDRIPSDFLEQYNKKIVEEIEEYSKHENFRVRVKTIFEDCINQVDFMKKVKTYSSETIDEKLFKNGFAFLFWLGSVTIAAILAALATKYIH
jgi:uncharacterized membrane-anchored protein